MSSTRWIYLTVVSIYFSEGILVSVFSAHLTEQGVGPGLVGSITSAFFLTSLLARLPAGLLYSPGRSRLLMGGSLAIMAVCTALYGFQAPDSLVWTRTLHGLAYGVASTVNLALFFAAAAEEDVNRVAAMGIFSASLSAGKMIGSLVGGLVAEYLGYSAAFVAGGLATLLGVWFTFMVRVRPEPKHDLPKRQGRPVANFIADLRAVPLAVWAASVMHFFLNLLRSMWEAFFPIYSLAVGFSIGTVGIMRGLDSLVGVFSRALSGQIGGRFKESALTHVGIAMAAVLVTVETYLSGVFSIGLTVLLLAVARAMATVTTGAGVMRASDSNNGRASGIGAAVYAVIRDIGNFSGPVLGGFVADYMGVTAMLRYLPLVLLGFFALAVMGFGAAERRALQ